MARKLTEQERQEIEAMRVVLTEALPPAQRGIASGIASSLVRTPADRITEEDLGRILGKYEEADDALAQVVRTTLLDAVDGQEGTYTVRVPEVDAAAHMDDQVQDDAGDDVLAEEPEESPVASGNADDGAGPAADPEPAGEGPSSQGPEGGSTEEKAEDSSEPSSEKEAPSPKSRRVRRRAPRTHKTVSAKPSADDEARVDDSQANEEGKAGKERPQADDGGKAKAQEAVSEKPDKAKPRRREPAPSRDLKKVPYVRRGGDTEAEVRQKILGLDQRFWVNGWLLSHPGAYTLFERELVAINDALSDGMLPGDITRRQLAYQMGGDEKFFEYGSDGFRLLRAMGMEDVIRHRPMPKPDLVYYAPRRRKHMRVLVTENLDPYLDVHDLMYEEGRTAILGQRIHAVVLGGGTPILERNRLALLLDTLGADTITVLYWGDIDRAGLEIMVKLKDVLGDGYKFRAFTPAYQLMVDKAAARFPDPADNESTGQVNIEPMDASLMVKGLTDEAAAYARAVIDDCGLIPQEILTRRDL